jgi:hypothetical protein
MNIGMKILIAIVVVLVLYVFLNWFMGGGSSKISGMKDGRQTVKLSASNLPPSKNTNNYTYSTWIYVNDWNYRFGEQKVLIDRKDKENGSSPSLSLAAMQNNLIVATAVYPTSEQEVETPISHTCTVDNIPLQRWVNIIVSLNGRTMDVYINGKLTRTCVLPGVPRINPEADVVITPSGGFSGWTAETTYKPNSINPQEAWNIYSRGYGGNLFSNLFNKYRVRVSLLEDNISRGSFDF